MTNDGAIHSSTAAPYNLAEIWPFPINGGESGGGGLDLRRVQFGQGLGQFAEKANREVSGGDDPMFLDHKGAQSGGSRKRRDVPEDESAMAVSTSSGNGMCSRSLYLLGEIADGISNCTYLVIYTGMLDNYKNGGSRDEYGDSKAEAEANSSKPVEQNTKPPEPPPKQDYIHVRARRGQATDSHSLAERVIGKALVLDEIINYIQSLQSQVEFLSMKLEAVNSRMNPDIEGFPPKDYGQQTFDAGGVAFGSQATKDYDRGLSPEWLHMQIGGGF
ncbi:hypothetical protein TEA_022870 [Camellia sinensis var. sinensis]|uniref:BHLH domain-containing protein n=1 Tax=Camellia sinensis var. sinensis TaxID=542762 RepID=A0A4S4DVZ5_CAMSN|nr:hypothetical protein TEA_022870 [Camellia sinensis var. sinensis]